MSIHLTPAILEAAYELLRVTPPFSKWKLPHADEVGFQVVGDRKRLGTYDGPPHRIAISAANIGSLPTLIRVMAHEMVHLHEAHRGLCAPNTEHSATFRSLARIVCAAHGFEPKEF